MVAAAVAALERGLLQIHAVLDTVLHTPARAGEMDTVIRVVLVMVQLLSGGPVMQVTQETPEIQAQLAEPPRVSDIILRGAQEEMAVVAALVEEGVMKRKVVCFPIETHVTCKPEALPPVELGIVPLGLHL